MAQLRSGEHRPQTDVLASFAVRQPEREGLGLRLVRMMVEGDLGGRAELDFQPSGLKAALRFKAAGTMAYRTPRAAAR